jgi:hypothetical protein
MRREKGEYGKESSIRNEEIRSVAYFLSPQTSTLIPKLHPSIEPITIGRPSPLAVSHQGLREGRHLRAAPALEPPPNEISANRHWNSQNNEEQLL